MNNSAHKYNYFETLCLAFSTPAIWCRIFMSRIFRSCIFDRPVFSCRAFSVAPRRYYLGCKIQKWVTWLWPRPFQGRFFIGRVGLAIVNQYKKLKSLGSPVTKLRLSILFNFNRNYAAIWYRFRHIASHLSKVVDFNLPHLHLAPPLGKTPAEIFCTSLRVVNLTAYLLHRS